jgi:hypothetical protein
MTEVQGGGKSAQARSWEGATTRQALGRFAREKAGCNIEEKKKRDQKGKKRHKGVEVKVDLLTVEGEGAGGYGRTGGHWTRAGESLARSGSTSDPGAGDGAVRRISGHAPLGALSVLADLGW